MWLKFIFSLLLLLLSWPFSLSCPMTAMLPFVTPPIRSHYDTRKMPSHSSHCLAKLFYLWAVHTGNIFRDSISRYNIIHQFFCDIPHILAPVSHEVFFVELVTLALSSCFVLGCFVLMIISYIQIFSTVLRIPSVENTVKVFSACSPQLIVIMLFLITGLFAALGPIAKTSSIQDLMIALAYTVLPPFLNPIIYSLRNKEIKAAVWRIFGKIISLRM